MSERERGSFIRNHVGLDRLSVYRDQLGGLRARPLARLLPCSWSKRGSCWPSPLPLTDFILSLSLSLSLFLFLSGPRVPSGGVTLKRRGTYRPSVIYLIVNKLLSSLSLSLSLSLRPKGPGGCDGSSGMTQRLGMCIMRGG